MWLTVDIHGDYAPEVLVRPVLERAVAWIHYGEVGVSSQTIWECLAPKECLLNPFSKNHRLPFHPHTPCDGSDFRRCWLLFRLIPEWRPRLPEVVAKHPGWKRLVEHWDELEKLYIKEREQGYSKTFNDRLHEVMGWK